jgi:hypothetical protein
LAGDSTITRAFGIGNFRNAAPAAAGQMNANYPDDVTTL